MCPVNYSDSKYVFFPTSKNNEKSNKQQDQILYLRFYILTTASYKCYLRKIIK